MRDTQLTAGAARNIGNEVIVTGGGGGGSGGGGGGSVLAGDVTGPIASNQATNCVILTPDTPTRNTVQPTADNIPSLILQWHSATQSERFLVCEDDTGTQKASINLTGEFQGRNVRVFQTDPSGTLFSANAANNTTPGTPGLNFITNADGSGNALNNWQILTDASFFWQSKTTTTFRTQAAIIPSWRDNTDATRAAQISFQLRGTGPASPLIEALNVSITGASTPMIGVLGAAAVARPAAYTLAGAATRVFPSPPAAPTGIDNTQVGSVYARVSDLATVTTALNSLIGVVRQIQTDLAGFGWMA